MLNKRDIEIIRKGVLAGIGLGALTAEKAQKVLNDLIRKGEVNKEEGKKIAQKLLAESKKYKNVLSGDIANEVKKSVTTILTTSKRETERLAEKIKALQKSPPKAKPKAKHKKKE